MPSELFCWHWRPYVPPDEGLHHSPGCLLCDTATIHLHGYSARVPDSTLAEQEQQDHRDNICLVAVGQLRAAIKGLRRPGDKQQHKQHQPQASSSYRLPSPNSIASQQHQSSSQGSFWSAAGMPCTSRQGHRGSCRCSRHRRTSDQSRSSNWGRRSHLRNFPYYESQPCYGHVQVVNTVLYSWSLDVKLHHHFGTSTPRIQDTSVFITGPWSFEIPATLETNATKAHVSESLRQESHASVSLPFCVYYGSSSTYQQTTKVCLVGEGEKINKRAHYEQLLHALSYGARDSVIIWHRKSRHKSPRHRSPSSRTMAIQPPSPLCGYLLKATKNPNSHQCPRVHSSHMYVQTHAAPVDSAKPQHDHRRPPSSTVRTDLTSPVRPHLHLSPRISQRPPSHCTQMPT
jgi:hypothetical protein